MASPAILIDLNVILDVFQHRAPFYAASAGVLSAVERGQARGYVAAHSLPTLFYLVQKTGGAQEARLAVARLMELLQVAPVDGETASRALALPYRDFEDAVQMAAALGVRADYVVTRDLEGFRPPLVPTITPAELLPLLQG